MSKITPWYRFKRRNNRRSRLAMFVWWTLVPWMLIPIWRLIYGFRIHHRDKCPNQGPVLVVCNHQSMLDPMIAGLALHSRGFRPLARSSLQQDTPKIIAWLIRCYDAIFIDRDNPGPSSMKKVLAELENGRVSILFPEGARSPDGTIQQFETGVWLLIRRGGAPILPMAVEGVHDVMPMGGKLRWKGAFQATMGDLIPSETLIEMGKDKALEHLRLIVDDLRMELREKIRFDTKGRWPKPGPGDQSLRGGTHKTSADQPTSVAGGD